ncbi:MAG: tyrosine-type recombinase/integrase [Nitrospiraceae bacterium]|nr:tyrosine-type recombinase/integrase [Nitrospiraceae bacterium]
MLGSAINCFQRHLKAAGRAPSTIASYSHALELLMGIVGNVKLAQINEEMIENAVIRLSSAARSTVTMNRIKSTFRSFFAWAAKSGLIPRNPAARLSLAKTDTQRTEPITSGEIETFIKTIRLSGDRHAERDYALFCIYAFTGVRRAEALALRVKDYDAVSRTLYLPGTKGGHPRPQPVPRRLADALGCYIRLLQKGNGAASAPACLFLGRNEHWPLSVRCAQTRFDKWKAASGIRNNLTIHSFRSGFATLLHQQTGDILLVANALGHSDIQTTQRYIRLNMRTVREAIERAFV